MRTGDQCPGLAQCAGTPRSRRCPGSITSRTIASYSVARAIQSASSPLRATSAASPSSRSPRRRRPAIFTSSSTMRTRMCLIVALEDEREMRDALTAVSRRPLRSPEQPRRSDESQALLIAVRPRRPSALGRDRDRAGGGDEQPLTGSTCSRPRRRPRAHGGGTVVETESGDDGAAYSVEIRREDGSQVEVNLDADFNVIGSAADDDGPGTRKARGRRLAMRACSSRRSRPAPRPPRAGARSPPTADGLGRRRRRGPAAAGRRARRPRPADFVAAIDNPYWPMAQGSSWVYRETDGEGNVQRVEVTVTDRRRRRSSASRRRSCTTS